MSDTKRFVERNSTNQPDVTVDESRFIDRISTNWFTCLVGSDRKAVKYIFSGLTSGARSQILRYIDNHSVFLMPTLIKNCEVEHSHGYKIIQKLRSLKLIIRTTDVRYKIAPSNRRYAGERPRIHHMSHIELTGRSDPRVVAAQKRYFEMIRREQIDVSQVQTEFGGDVVSELVEYYKSKKQVEEYAPYPIEIIKHLKDSPKYSVSVIPQDRKNYANKTYSILRTIPIQEVL